jgi:hypothetical protein
LAVFISDGITPPETRAFTVFITSPKRSRWHELKKSPAAKMLYFPVYSEAEILRCRDLCFPHLPVKEVMERYRKWGGIPRSVLLKVGLEEQEELEQEVGKMRYEIARDILEGEDPPQGVTDKLVHIKIAGEEAGSVLEPIQAGYYAFGHRELGTQYIADGVFRSWLDDERRQLRARIRTSCSRGLQIMAGQLDTEVRRRR